MVVEVFGEKLTSDRTYLDVCKFFIKFISHDIRIRNKLITYVLLVFIFGVSELIIISGFPAMIAIINSLSETKTLYYGDFTANYIFFNINSIEIYLLVFVFNSFLKIYLIWYLSVLGGFITNNVQNSIYEKIFLINKISINQSEIRSMLTNKIEFFYGSFVLAALFLIQALALLIACIFALNTISRIVIFFTLIILFSLYLIIFFLSRKNLKKNDKNIKVITTKITDKVDILLKDLRSIKANREYVLHNDDINSVNKNLRYSIALNFFLGNVPKNIIEISGFAIFFIFLFSLKYLSTDFEYFVLLGTIGLISIRLLPAIQRVYWSFNNLYSTRQTWRLIIETLVELDIQIVKEKIINSSTLNENFLSIELKNVPQKFFTQLLMLGIKSCYFWTCTRRECWFCL